MADKDSSEVMANTNSCVVKASSSFFDRQIMTNTAEHRRRKEEQFSNGSWEFNVTPNLMPSVPMDSYQRVMDQQVPPDSSSFIQQNVDAGASSSKEIENIEEGRKVNEHPWRYIPLIKATLRGDWKTAENFFERDKSALTAPIGDALKETALHIAVKVGKESIHFVEKLVEIMPVEALATTNSLGHTALHTAAVCDNTKAAAILAEKHRPLLYESSKFHMWPVHYAARSGWRDTVLYLLDVTGDDEAADYRKYGPKLIDYLIRSNFFDIASNLIERYPYLATITSVRGTGVKWGSPLEWMAAKVRAFPSGSQLNFWQRKIYPYVPVKLKKCSIKDQNKTGDVQINIPQVTSHAHKDNWAQSFWENISSEQTVSQHLQAILWKVLELSVPQIKHIQEEKLLNVQALQLVKTLVRTCYENNTHSDDAIRVVYNSMAKAIDTGIPEIIEEIEECFPFSAFNKFPTRGGNFLQRAILERHERVFNLVYQMAGHRNLLTSLLDHEGNNILHLAGRLAPPKKLSLVPGAALQMQRELQWFEAVKKLGPLGLIDETNHSQETPEMVFTKEHEDLRAKGETWMKDTANSCTIPAALIVTIVFAAAITVPGGNKNDSGFPMFFHKVAFIVFAVSDAISLFTSATSLLMFLSILTSRFAESDFLKVLPTRLIIGLFTLFLSITTMVVAFSCTLYVVFGQNKAWILVPVAALACLPITSFITLQFPLLVALTSSTYGKSIFSKQNDKVIY